MRCHIPQQGKEPGHLAVTVQHGNVLRADTVDAAIGHFLRALVADRFSPVDACHRILQLGIGDSSEHFAHVMAVDAMGRQIQPAPESLIVIAVHAFRVDIGHHQRQQFVGKTQLGIRPPQHEFGLLAPLHFLVEAVFGDREALAAMRRRDLGARGARHHRQHGGKQGTGEKGDPLQIEQREIDRHDKNRRRDQHRRHGDEGLHPRQQIGANHDRHPTRDSGSVLRLERPGEWERCLFMAAT